MRNQDMSMEEILASIRKIISEDQKSPSKTSSTPPFSSTPYADASSEKVLELNQQIQEDGSIRLLAPEGTVTPPSPIRSKNFEESTQRVTQTPLAPATPSGKSSGSSASFPTVPSASGRSTGTSSSPPPPRATIASRERSAELLVSETTAAASLQNFQKLLDPKGLTYPRGTPQTFEEVIQEALHTWMDKNLNALVEKLLKTIVPEQTKPLLGAWMDRNLPAIVEKIVREQIHLIRRQN
ncbi:MAG: DUF2497 domain-containing protein [Holosporales bacterium]|nr:DUF2497 domain-containing protein [Holosporales bacterium]